MYFVSYIFIKSKLAIAALRFLFNIYVSKIQMEAPSVGGH